jgi:hypothetical protein
MKTMLVLFALFASTVCCALDFGTDGSGGGVSVGASNTWTAAQTFSGGFSSASGSITGTGGLSLTGSELFIKGNPANQASGYGSLSYPLLQLFATSSNKTGFYMAGATDLSVAVGGTQMLTIGSNANMQAYSGTDVSPTYAGLSDPNSGLYLPGSDVVAINAGAVRMVTISSPTYTTQINSLVNISSSTTASVFMGFAGAFVTLPTTGYAEGTLAYQTSDHKFYGSTATVNDSDDWVALH